MNLKKYIRDIPDFPSPGILFRDITPLLKEPKAFNYVLMLLREKLLGTKVTAIAAIESRGFIFGAPLAASLDLPFIPIRKPGKLPYEAVKVNYSLEYGEGSLEVHSDAFTANDTVAIIDDVLATGGTARGAVDLVGKLGGEVGPLLFVIELTYLNGRSNLVKLSVDSVLQY